MFNTYQSLAKAAVWITSVTLLPSCVGTDLVARSDHPGSPNARSAKLPVTVGLLSDFDAGSHNPAAPRAPHDHGPTSHESHAPHAEHGSSHQHAPGSATDASTRTHDSAGPGNDKGDTDAGAVRYTCPMHPEVVRGEAGTCPKCGMKLVPKAKDPK